jgi:hypothetical protein
MDEAKASTIDPDRWYKTNSVAKGIMGAIGGVLGGMMQGLQGGENQFQKHVDGLIARDIGAQKEALASKRQSVADKMSLLNVMRGRFSDERAADLAAHMWYREQVASRLEQQAAEIGTPLAKANADMAKNQLRAANNSDQMQLEQMAYVPKQVLGGVGSGVSDKDQSLLVNGPDGRTYKVADSAARTKLADFSAAAIEMKNLANELDMLRNSPATYASAFGVQVTDQARRARAIGDRMITLRSTIGNSGIMNDAEFERFSKELGDPNAITSGAGAKGKNLVNLMENAFSAKLKAEKVEEVSTGYKPTVTGGIAPTAAYTGSSPKKTSLPGGFKPVGEK